MYDDDDDDKKNDKKAKRLQIRAVGTLHSNLR